jgi:hypothetical protein
MLLSGFSFFTADLHFEFLRSQARSQIGSPQFFTIVKHFSISSQNLASFLSSGSNHLQIVGSI